MKKIIICAAMICAIAMFSGCQSAETATTSQQSTDSVVSFVTDDSSSDSSVASEKNTSSNDTETDENASDSDSDVSSTEAFTDSDLETDTQTDTDLIGENTDYDVIPEVVESSLSGYEEEISGVWTANYILDQDNNEIDGSVIYGTGYTQYGGELDINSDGTFSVRMGVSTEDETTKGTYTYEGDSDITLLYYDDSTVICERCTVNGEEAIAMPIDLFGDIYTIYFMR